MHQLPEDVSEHLTLPVPQGTSAWMKSTELSSLSAIEEQPTSQEFSHTSGLNHLVRQSTYRSVASLGSVNDEYRNSAQEPNTSSMHQRLKSIETDLAAVHSQITKVEQLLSANTGHLKALEDRIESIHSSKPACCSSCTVI